MQTYTAKEIAEYIIDYCYYTLHHSISNLRLQYILYYSQINSHKENNCAIFEEDFEIRDFGPCLVSAYNK